MAVNICLIGSKAPVYVAGLDLGVLPIGDWSITITLSIAFIPFNSFTPWGKGTFNPREWHNAGWSNSFIKVLFPLPLTPVTETNLPKGNSTELFFKLFLEQLFKIKLFFTDDLRSFGVGIDFLPLR